MPQRHPPSSHKRLHPRLLLPRRADAPFGQALLNRLPTLRARPCRIEPLDHIPTLLAQKRIFIFPISIVGSRFGHARTVGGLGRILGA